MVSVTACPTAGFWGLAVSVTAGDFPPLWQPSQPEEANPLRRASAARGQPASASTTSDASATADRACGAGTTTLRGLPIAQRVRAPVVTAVAQARRQAASA